MTSFETLSNKLGDGQSHVLTYWDQLNDEEKHSLASQIDGINVGLYEQAFKEVQMLKPQSFEQISPISEDRHIVKSELDPKIKDEHWDLGLKAISRGEVGAIVMAGGQATRLGADQPKGTINLGLGLSSTDSLLWIQAARIARLLKLAKEAYPDSSPSIQWLVMTSNSTMEETRNHLVKVVQDVGISMDDVTIFSQAEIPCFDLNGKFLLSSRSSLATAPDGNGGLYAAIRPLLPKLKSRGVKHFHIVCVDNILCRIADPHLIGCAIDMNADCAATTVEKTNPFESVGVVCLESGHVRVLEYSEIPKELAEKRDPNGKLSFRAGSVAMHYFTMDFLEKVSDESVRLPFHVAKKKIPYFDLSTSTVVQPKEPNGIKLEQFVFDVFPHAKRFLVWEVLRHEEFSPLKNAEHVGRDCISTIRRDFASECRRWLARAGVELSGDKYGNPVYISPLVSYAGEDLSKGQISPSNGVIKMTNGLLVENGTVAQTS
uniref:UDP-N-acetylglucosamine diphosphorylase n=1 Tax=Acrobeloides nanus TaxID=290746 RepID=A0A914CAA6_9BILA